MNNFFRIVRLQFRNMLRRNRSGGKKGGFIAAAIALAILYAIIAGFFIMVVSLLGGAFVYFELESEFVTLLLMCGLMLVLIFGIVAVLNCLYFSRDTEFFLSLPVKPGTVFAAKMTVVYAVELLTTALILVPCLIAVGVTMHMSAVFYILLPFAVLLLPAIPLFFAAIIAIPIMYLVSFLRNRGSIGSILVLLLFGGFFAAYYYGVSKLQNLDVEQVDLSGVRDMFVNISNTVYPLYAAARAMTLAPAFGLSGGAAVAVNLLIYVGSIVAIGVIAFLISSAVYKRGAASQLESPKKKNAVASSYRGSGVVKSLMKKEWREIVRTPAFAMNSLLGVVLCPIIVGFLGFTTRSSAAMEGGQMSPLELDIYNTIMRYVMLAFVMFMGVATNSAPSTSFSREGEKIHFCKIMPIDCATQIKAKSYVYNIIGLCACVLGTVASAIVNFDAVFMICSIVLLAVFNYAAVNFGIMIDLRRSKLKWVTPNEAMKHNRNAMIAVFVTMFAAVLVALIGGILYMVVFTRASKVAATVVSWLVMFIAVFVFAALSSAFLYKDCERRLDEMEV